jgi:SAM-dependent methyltransferase
LKVYDKIFDWYVTARNPEAGVDAIKKFTKNLRHGAKILELGCGYGFPIANMLYKQGFNLYGIDSSVKMVERFKKDLPDVPIQCSNVLSSNFFSTRFDAIIAYGLIIHLSQDQQVKVVEKVSEHLHIGGVFLFNSGDEDGEKLTPPGYNGGERFMNYSMSCVNYEKALSNNHMLLENHYIEKGYGGTIYLARKLSYTQA